MMDGMTPCGERRTNTPFIRPPYRRPVPIDPHSLADQIRQDAADGTFTHWGRSTLLDENTGTPMLDATTLALLQQWAGLPVEHPVTNAGLAHVYGYLLSTAETPYGRKRDRWLDGSLATALGLPPDHFLPWHRPDARTLAQRVTDAVLPVLAAPPADALLVREDSGTGLRTVVTGGGALVYGWAGRAVTAFPVGTDAGRIAELRGMPDGARYNAVCE